MKYKIINDYTSSFILMSFLTLNYNVPDENNKYIPDENNKYISKESNLEKYLYYDVLYKIKIIY